MYVRSKRILLTLILTATAAILAWRGLRIFVEFIASQATGIRIVENTTHTNRLIDENSPYLLQHAHNPVDWYPWGDEAFERARTEDKPIFLSIGYSTCHWCHVMERESFEDTEIAALMNDAFINIKVDREERPDIDNVYMTVCQMLTGSGGWPLTIIMTPGKEPFFAGTYYPKENRLGRIGMVELIPRLKELWETKREDILGSAQRIQENLQAAVKSSAQDSVDIFTEEILQRAYRQLEGNFDEVSGGFGSAPKFPTPHNLLFLLRYWKRTGESKALQMVEKTLSQMRKGGMYDHVGFGFHRYSTDNQWLLPHFEKMLYDQALLTMAYTEAFLATGKDEYRKTAQEIITYVLRDMTSPEGAFYSADDADSEGHEGKFYVWTEAEIRQILGDEADLIIELYGVERDGNFSEEASGQKSGENILHLRQSVHELSSRLSLPEQELTEAVDAALNQLFDVREKRVHPHKDDKILTDWNGLMIAALSKATLAFEEPDYAEAASRCAQFFLQKMRQPDGGLLHRYRRGEGGITAHLDDYSFFIWGLLELYETTFEVDLLQAALDLNEYLTEHFWDEEDGGLFFTSSDGESLLVRYKEIYDAAIPSGNSVAALNLLRLARATSNTEMESQAIRIGRAFTSTLERSPSISTLFLSAVEFAVGGSYEIVITGDFDSEDTRAMLRALRKQYLPNKIILFKPDHPDAAIVSLAEFTRNQESLNGKTTAYVCQDNQCNLPTTVIDEMLHLLQ